MNTYGIAGMEDRQYAAMEQEYEQFLAWCENEGFDPDVATIEEFRDWMDNARLDAQEDAAEARANW